MEKFEKAKQEYNEIMYSIGIEFATIGTNFSEGTEGWNLRDMVSEMQYHLDCCYEDGNANADGRSISFLMNTYGMDVETAHDEHTGWLTKTRMLRAFINKYKKEALALNCAMCHCSKFD